MNLPFEQLGHFVVWYIDPKVPIVITNSDFKRICDETEFDDPLQSAELKMAVVLETGVKERVIEPSRVFTKSLLNRIEDNGWPYTYCFEGSEALLAVSAYLSAFCFINKRFSVDVIRTTIDNRAIYSIKKRRFLKKIEVESFSAEAVLRVVGPSLEFFAVLDGGNVLYFGHGKVQQIYIDQSQSVIENADYFDLMSFSHRKK